MRSDAWMGASWTKRRPLRATAKTAADAEVTLKQTAENTERQAVQAANAELDTLHNKVADLDSQLVEQMEATSDHLGSVEADFLAWVDKLRVTSGGLVTPLPYKEIGALSGAEKKKTEMGNAFGAYLANADYLFNRVLVVANQCKLDEAAAQLADLDKVDGLRILQAIDRSDSGRLVATAQLARLNVALHASLFRQSQGRTKQTQSGLSRPSAGGNPDNNIAKGNVVATRWATRFCEEQTLAPHDHRTRHQAKGGPSEEGVRGGWPFAKLVQTPTRKRWPTYLLPLSEFLRVSGHGRFRDCNKSQFDGLQNLVRENEGVRTVVTALARMVNGHNCFAGGFDLAAFTTKLNEARARLHVADPPPHNPEINSVKGLYGYTLHASVSGYDNLHNSAIQLTEDEGGRDFVLSQPKEIFDGLVGFDNSPGATKKDLLGRALHAALVLLASKDSTPPPRELVVTKPEALPVNDSVIVCVLRLNDTWVVARITVVVQKGANQSNPAHPQDIIEVREIILCNPLGDTRGKLYPALADAKTMSESPDGRKEAAAHKINIAVGQVR